MYKERNARGYKRREEECCNIGVFALWPTLWILCKLGYELWAHIKNHDELFCQLPTCTCTFSHTCITLCTSTNICSKVCTLYKEKRRKILFLYLHPLFHNWIKSCKMYGFIIHMEEDKRIHIYILWKIKLDFYAR